MRASTFAAAVVLAACSAGAAAQPADAKKLKDQLTGDARAPASANPQCKLFTPAEIQGFLGAAVGPGENGAGGLGCTWHDKGYSVLSYVTVVGARMYAEPSLVKGFKRLPAIAPKAWVAPQSGWSAGTFEGDLAIVVNLDSPTATEAKVVAFLQETIKRRSR